MQFGKIWYVAGVTGGVQVLAHVIVMTRIISLLELACTVTPGKLVKVYIPLIVVEVSTQIGDDAPTFDTDILLADVSAPAGIVERRLSWNFTLDKVLFELLVYFKSK